MGIYAYIHDWELPQYNKVSDETIEGLIKLILESGVRILVKEYNYTCKRFLKKDKTVTYYYIYFDKVVNNKRTSEVRCTWGIGQDRESTINYLSGLIDGIDSHKLYNENK